MWITKGPIFNLTRGHFFAEFILLCEPLLPTLPTLYNYGKLELIRFLSKLLFRLRIEKVARHRWRNRNSISWFLSAYKLVPSVKVQLFVV